MAILHHDPNPAQSIAVYLLLASYFFREATEIEPTGSRAAATARRQSTFYDRQAVDVMTAYPAALAEGMQLFHQMFYQWRASQYDPKYLLRAILPVQDLE